MDAKQAVSQARSALVLDHPFFGVLSLKLELIEDRKTKTFSVNGKVLKFNPSYVQSLNKHEMTGVVAHEVLHCANGHNWRRGHRDPKLWNLACDYAINPIVLDAGMFLPEGALVAPRFKGMAAEEIYEILLRERQDQGSQQKFDNSSDGDGQEGQSSSGDDQNTGNSQDSSGGESGSESEDSQPDGSECGEVIDCEDNQMPEMQAEWEAAVVNAARIQGMGKLPESMERLVEDIKNPPQDWRSILRRFAQASAKSDYTWTLPNGRYLHAGLYLPSLHNEQMGCIVAVIDTSGSIDDLILSQFAIEINTIVDELQPEQVHIIYCDSDVRGVDVFERGEEVIMSPRGGGGTDFRPPFDYVEKEEIEPACLVYLTDMWGIFPDTEPAYPVLWGDTTGGGQAPFGESVHITCA